VFDEIMVVVFFISFIATITIPYYSLFKETKDGLKQYDAEKQNNEHQRRELEEYMSGSDYD